MAFESSGFRPSDSWIVTPLWAIAWQKLCVNCATLLVQSLVL